MYDPNAARFLSKDPTEYFGNDANLYRYCGNDPVNGTDPTGHEDEKKPALPYFFDRLADGERKANE